MVVFIATGAERWQRITFILLGLHQPLPCDTSQGKLVEAEQTYEALQAKMEKAVGDEDALTFGVAVILYRRGEVLRQQVRAVGNPPETVMLWYPTTKHVRSGPVVNLKISYAVDSLVVGGASCAQKSTRLDNTLDGVLPPTGGFQGKYAAADPLFLGVLEMWKEAGGEHDEFYASAIGSRALLLAAQVRIGPRLQYSLQILRISMDSLCSC